MKAVVRIGDSTTSGGKVVMGNMKATEKGRPIACKGDLVICPSCYPRSGPISEGCDKWKINGREVALHGHKVSCGCPNNTLIAGQFEDGVK